jgi:hypothetical protein
LRPRQEMCSPVQGGDTAIRPIMRDVQPGAHPGLQDQRPFDLARGEAPPSFSNSRSIKDMNRSYIAAVRAVSLISVTPLIRLYRDYLVAYAGILHD